MNKKTKESTSKAINKFFTLMSFMFLMAIAGFNTFIFAAAAFDLTGNPYPIALFMGNILLFGIMFAGYCKTFEGLNDC